MKIPFEKTLRQPPPRRIGIYSQMAILFSGFMQQMGWIFVCMGMLFTLIFLPFSDWKYTLTKGPWELVQGELIASEATNTTVNDSQIWEYSYKYTMQGNEFAGRSYDFGRNLSPGQEVSVRANVRKPWVSKIDGMTASTTPKFLTFVLIFPIAGLFMVIPGLRTQGKSLDLLRNGEFTRGEIKSKEHTGTTITINDVPYPVMKYTFSFQYQGAEYQAICKTHITGPLEDEEQETILFYPTKPDFNIVYDGISNSPGMDPMGNFLPVSWTKAWVFLGPAVGIFMTAIALRLFFLI